ncbi:hypothetical protein BHE74_00024183 [Ensete ventricosum]|nr:hypothetical protein BHE74_00024183 [Ensete ventricosum]RZS12926.1 hypothetical protein BHM03_00044435 [Ensete ventricosum]
MSTTALQKTLDYACGAGADCTPILQNGACYNPNTVLAHCSYAANSYYQGKGQTQDACNFAGTAMLTSTDPGNQSLLLMFLVMDSVFNKHKHHSKLDHHYWNHRDRRSPGRTRPRRNKYL